MNKPISVRQAVFMFLFISISPVLRSIPSALAREAGRSGYLSPFWSIPAMALLTAIIILLIKSYPGLNLYEIMVQLAGKVFAKSILCIYLIWILLYLTTKINAYALSLQFTLMPKTKSNFFIQIMLILVYYALLRGSKTVFRFSEFALGPVFLLIGILFVCAVSRLRADYLLPVSTINLPATVRASKDVVSVGGNLLLTLFFADNFEISISKKQMRKFWSGALIFIVFSFVITIFTFGITGASICAYLPFPFYITVKSISFFNIFERFEVIVTLICLLSDFITICILFIILMSIIRWLFNIEEKGFLFLPLAVIIYYLTYYVSKTQFEFDFLYNQVVVYLNLIFPYIIPIIFGILCLIKRKSIKKLY